MSFLYKSTTGTAVNAGSFVVTVTGTSYDEKIPALDALVGDTLTCETLKDDETAVVVAPVATPRPAQKAS